MNTDRQFRLLKVKRFRSMRSDTIQYKILGEHMEYRKVKDYSLGHAVAGIVDWKRAIESMTDKTQYRYYYINSSVEWCGDGL